MIGLALLWGHSGKSAEGGVLLGKALEVSRRVLGEEHPTTLSAMNIQAVGNQDLPMLVKVLEVSRRVLGEGHRQTLANMNNLACFYRDHGKLVEAEPLLVKALEVSRRVQGEEHRDTLLVMRNLGKLYLTQGKLAQAEPLLLSSYEGITARDQGIPFRVERHLVPALKEIVQLYEAWGKPERAAEWRAKLPRTAAELPADVFARP
jgi:hypothetical protein